VAALGDQGFDICLQPAPPLGSWPERQRTTGREL
jgi:hypothetical protein